MAKPTNEMTAVELARRLAELGEAEKALQAYGLALKQEDTAPADRFEAACAVLQYGEDYRPAYDAFLSLCNEEALHADALSILTDAFYAPNQEQMKKRYEKNCKLLKKYPYIFRTDFLPFEELPIKFYPYDDNGVIPFHVREERFDGYTDFDEPVVRHYFFRDLEKPVLAEEIVSHYELEYLKDNVRRSDWVGKENHIYLHYADWGVFCSHLQHWDMKTLLEESKFVFLMGDEIGMYPIDFKERFGIDYSQYKVKSLGIREIHKIIWHTQLYCHNGGDFFNEVLHGHPYLLADTSAMFKDTLETFRLFAQSADTIAKNRAGDRWDDYTLEIMDRAILEELVTLRHRSLKDCVVAYYLGQKKYTRHLDPNSRIVPAIIYQPHFGTMNFRWEIRESGRIYPYCSAFEDIKASGLLQQFKYIKTFTPMRRPTTSHGATVRFMQKQVEQGYAYSKTWETAGDKPAIMSDPYFDRIMNRSFMVDVTDRLVADNRLVRFEDGKTNPTAVFTALAEFMDVPYTKTMTYCSDEEGIDPVYEGVAVGFDPAPAYRTYEDFSDESERILAEYLLRDLYEFYGYDFRYYDGKPMTQEEIETMLEQCRCNLDLIEKSWWAGREKLGRLHDLEGEALDRMIKDSAEKNVAKQKEVRLIAIRILRHGLHFCSADGKPLRMMEPLKLDPALLQTELYH